MDADQKGSGLDGAAGDGLGEFVNFGFFELGKFLPGRGLVGFAFAAAADEEFADVIEIGIGDGGDEQC